MEQPQPRIRLPEQATRGEILLVRALITHQMETGLRSDPGGKPIPRKIINRFVCRYIGETVFEVELHEAVSANPYLEFHIEATESGLIELTWHEDGGAVYAASHRLEVVAA